MLVATSDRVKRGFVSSIRFWIGLLVSVLCLWIAIQPVPIALLAQSLADARYVWLVPALGLQFLAVVARARRWVVLLQWAVNLADAFWAVALGYLITNVLPFRLGEPARVLALAKR